MSNVIDLCDDDDELSAQQVERIAKSLEKERNKSQENPTRCEGRAKQEDGVSLHSPEVLSEHFSTNPNRPVQERSASRIEPRSVWEAKNLPPLDEDELAKASSLAQGLVHFYASRSQEHGAKRRAIEGGAGGSEDTVIPVSVPSKPPSRSSTLPTSELSQSALEQTASTSSSSLSAASTVLCASQSDQEEDHAIRHIRGLYVNKLKVKGEQQKSDDDSTKVPVITFPQLVDVPDLEEALLTMFMFDRMLYDYMPKDVHCTIIRHYNPNEDKPGTFKIAPNKTIIHPHVVSTRERSKMHAKLILLKTPSTLRVAICTANITRYEWHQMAQATWYRDFPSFASRTPPGGTGGSSTTAQSDAGNSFLCSLEHLLGAMDCPQNWIRYLRLYDFSDTADVRIVANVPGAFSCNSQTKFGLSQLAEVVKEWQHPQRPDTVDVVASSVGWLTKWAGEFRKALSGRPLLQVKLAKRKRDTVQEHEKEAMSEKVPEVNVRVRFMSERQVRETQWPEVKELLWLDQKSWEHKDFERGWLYSLKFNTRALSCVVSHMKLIVWSADSGEENNRMISFVYVGSHNCSKAAWGTIKPRKKEIAMDNFEVGVMIKVGRKEKFAPIPLNISDDKSMTEKGILPFFGKGGIVP